MSAGIKIFESMAEALAAGFEPFEKTADGYLVRRGDGHAFALALVKAKTENGDESDVVPESNAGLN
ncbi:MAG TPA: hypothetical protein VEJ20_04450 [Candidatus Eremiobacteraceae bacterium]|nr:hypothetical protein [Candidatus Eremiobacteraceae bacterium]